MILLGLLPLAPPCRRLRRLAALTDAWRSSIGNIRRPAKGVAVPASSSLSYRSPPSGRVMDSASENVV